MLDLAPVVHFLDCGGLFDQMDRQNEEKATFEFIALGLEFENAVSFFVEKDVGFAESSLQLLCFGIPFTQFPAQFMIVTSRNRAVFKSGDVFFAFIGK